MVSLVVPHRAEICNSQLNALNLGAAVRDRGHVAVLICNGGSFSDRIRVPSLESVSIRTGRPVAERWADEVLSVPPYPKITPEQQECVAEVLQEALR